MRIFFGWYMVTVAACMSLPIGVLNGWGVYFLPLQQDFGWSYAVTSSVFSLAAIVFAISSILSGFLLIKFGTRRVSLLGSVMLGAGLLLASGSHHLVWMYLFFGVVAAMGISFLSVPSFVIVMSWFVAKRGLAVGIASLGVGFGSFLVPVLSESVIATAGWRTALLVLGLLLLVISLASSFFSNLTPAIKGASPLGYESGSGAAQGDPGHGYSVSRAARLAPFWGLFLSILFGSVSMGTYIIHMVPYAVSVGIERGAASQALGLLGVGTIIGRLTLTPMSDRLGRTKSLALAYVIMAVALFNLLFLTPDRPYLMLISSAMVGYSFGGFFAGSVAATGDFFGLLAVGILWGFMETAWGIGSIVGPIFAGFVFDTSRTYAISIEVAGLTSIVAAAISVLIRPPPPSPASKR